MYDKTHYNNNNNNNNNNTKKTIYIQQCHSAWHNKHLVKLLGTGLALWLALASDIICIHFVGEEKYFFSTLLVQYPGPAN